MPVLKRFNAVAEACPDRRTWSLSPSGFTRRASRELEQKEQPVKNSSTKKHRRPAASLRHATHSADAGRETLREVLSQPDIWIETARRFEARGQLAKLAELFFPREPWLFVACGSSYYLARTVAAQWTKLLHIRCTATPASELLFAPQDTLARAGAKQAVLISRSGKTTEVLRAAQLLKANSEMRTLGITCNGHSELAALCSATLTLPWADEKSMVMTRSFTSILLLLATLAVNFSADRELAAAMDALPQKAAAWLSTNADMIRAFGAKRSFSDFVFLGQGAHYWLAQEAALKLTEMSSSYAQAYHTLEFRHGPKSIASRETLITFFLSDAAAAEETLLVPEVRKLGASTMVIVNRATESLRRHSDLLVELALEAPEFPQLALAAFPAQLLGLAVGLRKGLNPDIPKNLTRAVVLTPENGASPSLKRRAD
jgi:glutamine---fructose-6-phosphate transaminase (isomerizing)